MVMKNIDKKSILKYAISELPASVLSLTFAAAAAEIGKRTTGSDIVSTIMAAPSGSIGFFIGKSGTHVALHTKEYLKGERSIFQDFTSIGKSMLESIIVKYSLKATLQYTLQRGFGVMPAIASVSSNIVSGTISGIVRYLRDLKRGVYRINKDAPIESE